MRRFLWLPVAGSIGRPCRACRRLGELSGSTLDQAAVGAIGTGRSADRNWCIKPTIDVEHPLAWHVVQELGCVLNCLSLRQRLATVFMPVSPAPYLNGGPPEALSWVIESKDPQFNPGTCMKWHESRLPRPVDEVAQWRHDDG